MNLTKCTKCEIIERLKTMTLKECIKRLKISVSMNITDTEEELQESSKPEEMLNLYYLQNLHKYLSLYEQYLDLYANETTG